MSKYYYSFGQSHTHRVHGVTLDKDSIVEIIAPDDERGMEAARAKMFDTFGQKWSMQYDDASLDLSYFPRGIVLTLHAGGSP